MCYSLPRCYLKETLSCLHRCRPERSEATRYTIGNVPSVKAADNAIFLRWLPIVYVLNSLTHLVAQAQAGFEWPPVVLVDGAPC